MSTNAELNAVEPGPVEGAVSERPKVNAVEPVASEPAMEYVARQLYFPNLKDLHPDPNQPRKHFDDNDIKDLAASIKKHGVLQPVLFRVESSKLILVSGERRYRASVLAKQETIPAIFTDGKPAEIALIENIMRVDMTPLEEAEGLKKLKEEAGYKNKDLATIIGKAESSISEMLSLNKLDDTIKEVVRADTSFSRRQLIEIAKVSDVKEMKKKFKQLRKYNTSSVELKAGATEGDKRGNDEVILERMVAGLSGKLDAVDLSDGRFENVRTKLAALVELLGQKLN